MQWPTCVRTVLTASKGAGFSSRDALTSRAGARQVKLLLSRERSTDPEAAAAGASQLRRMSGDRKEPSITPATVASPSSIGGMGAPCVMRISSVTERTDRGHRTLAKHTTETKTVKGDARCQRKHQTQPQAWQQEGCRVQ